MKRAKFSIEGFKPFPGYHLHGDTWNGWARPYFEWEVAIALVEWMNEWSGEKKMDFNHEAKTIIDLDEPEEPFDINGERVSTEDGELVLYPVGAGWWIWDIHEPDDN